MANAAIIRLDDVRSGRPIRGSADKRLPLAIPTDHIRPTVLSGEVSGQSRGMLLGFAASLLLHLSIGLWYVWAPASTTIGGGGMELDSIAIEIVSASALESEATSAPEEGAGASQPTQIKAGDGMAVDQAEMTAITPEPKQEPPPPENPVATLELPPRPGPEVEFQVAEKVEDKPPEKPPVEQPPEPQQRAEVSPIRDAQEAQQAMSAGGAVAEARADLAGQPGAAGANSGEVAMYAIAVRRAVGKARPSHSGAKGRVTIAFGLTEAGAVRFARVATSSGAARLDEAALRAVEATSFPSPPAGMSDAQRTYSVPFEFR